MKTSMNTNGGLVLTCLFLASCLNPVAVSQGPFGALVVSAGTAPRTILPSGTFLTSYEAGGVGPSGALAANQTSTTGSFAFEGLVPGSWTFTVHGLDGSGTAVASGSRTLTITSQGGQSANITLAPTAGGTGSLSLAVSWSGGRSVTSVTGILIADGGTSTPIEFTNLTTTGATYSGSFVPGSYVLTVRAQNGTSVIAASRLEAVVIYRGQTSSWSATIADDQFLSSAKDITAFGLTSPLITGTITGTNIALSLPSATNASSLAPTISVSSGASVSPASGVAQDFTNPVTYTVTAADGTTQVYTVTATVLGSAGLSSTTPSAVTVTLSGNTATLDSGSTMTVTATATPSADSYAWYLDGSAQSGQTASSITVGSGLTLGSHTLMVVAKKDGLLFSTSHPFVVKASVNVTTLRAGYVDPWGIVSDGSFFYVAVRGGSQRIDKLDGNGTVINTLTSNQFQSPQGITTDGTHLYVTNFQSGTISRIDLATWSVDVTPFATGFSNPSGITSDGEYLYVSNHGTGSVSRVALSNGAVVSAFVTGLTNPNGITTDGTTLYIANSGATNVMMAPRAGGPASVLVSSATTGGHDIVGVATDGTFLYLANYGAHRIDSVALSSPGTKATLAGTGVGTESNGPGASASFHGPAQIVVDANRLFVVDQLGGTVRKITQE